MTGAFANTSAATTTTTTITTITSPSTVGERRKEGWEASLRSSRNKLRPHTHVRSPPRLLARSRSPARFILSLFIAESCLPPSLRSFIFAHLPLGRNFSGMQTAQNQPVPLGRWYFIVTCVYYINDCRYEKAFRKIGHLRLFCTLK